MVRIQLMMVIDSYAGIHLCEQNGCRNGFALLILKQALRKILHKILKPVLRIL